MKKKHPNVIIGDGNVVGNGNFVITDGTSTTNINGNNNTVIGGGSSFIVTGNDNKITSFGIPGLGLIRHFLKRHQKKNKK